MRMRGFSSGGCFGLYRLLHLKVVSFKESVTCKFGLTLVNQQNVYVYRYEMLKGGRLKS